MGPAGLTGYLGVLGSRSIAWLSFVPWGQAAAIYGRRQRQLISTIGLGAAGVGALVGSRARLCRADGARLSPLVAGDARTGPHSRAPALFLLRS